MFNEEERKMFGLLLKKSKFLLPVINMLGYDNLVKETRNLEVSFKCTTDNFQKNSIYGKINTKK